MDIPSRTLRRHQPELDGIRGIAILAVLLCHMFSNLDLFPQTHLASILRRLALAGWWGVDLFFALSGFLITGILLRTRSADNYYKSFYARRFLRIFPLYYAALTTIFIIAHFTPVLHAVVPSGTLDRVLNYLYLQTWPFFWHHQNLPSNALGPYWSLAVEEQFYLVWPFLVASLSERMLIRLCAAGFLLGFPFRLLLSHFVFGYSPQLILTPLTRLDGLFAGAFVALYMFCNSRPIPKLWSLVSIAAGVVGVVVITRATSGKQILASGPWMRTLGITAISLASAGLIAYSQHHPRHLQKILQLRPLRKFGEYSYGLYVYHLLLYIFLDVQITKLLERWRVSLSFAGAGAVSALCLGICFLLAKLSFDGFESRFINLKRHFVAHPNQDVGTVV